MHILLLKYKERQTSCLIKAIIKVPKVSISNYFMKEFFIMWLIV